MPGAQSGVWAYFNHRYWSVSAQESDTLAVTDYGGPYASVGWARTGFRGAVPPPEKSQDLGLHILRNFVERVGAPDCVSLKGIENV